MAAKGVSLVWRGESLELLPERALFWPRERVLILADVHLGKAAVFRAQGVPIPEGTDGHDLSRIARLARETEAQELIVLGDWVHGSESWTPELIDALQRDLPPLLLTLIPGNHDPAALLDRGIHAGLHRVLPPGTQRGPFALHHVPPELPPVALPGGAGAPPDSPGILAGHLHPVVRLRGSGGTLRFPCFWVTEDLLLLPAFGSFTGGGPLPERPGARAFAVHPEGVTEVPTPFAGGRRHSRRRGGPG